MSATQGEAVTVVGAGLAGPLIAAYLAERGHSVTLYERRPDIRRVAISAGRSINLALSTRGIEALTRAGLGEEVKRLSIPMLGRMTHARDGATALIPYGKDDSQFINSISRGGLNAVLLDLAERRGATVHFGRRCTGIDFATGELALHDETGGAETRVAGGRVIAADGAFSAVRTELIKLPRVEYSQSYLPHGYKELTIPAGSGGTWQLEKNALHIWPRDTYMLIALPNLDGSFTCTLFLALTGEPSFAMLGDAGAVRRFFGEQFPDAVPLMPDLVDDFFANPTGDLVTIRCFPWHAGGRVVLLGDAAHAIVPFYGQGMNAAFEDCAVLDDEMARAGGDWESAFAAFGSRRKPNTDAIAEMAVENFVEMRDLVAEPRFLLEKKIEGELQRRHPDRFVPKYQMVTFSTVPYAVAHERARQQQRILSELSENRAKLDDIDWERGDTLVSSLPPFPQPIRKD